MKAFSYHMPTRVVLGKGSAAKLGQYIQGERVLIVCDPFLYQSGAAQVAQAERELRDGRSELEQGRKEAAAAADAAMKKAEEAAAGRRKEILAQAEKDCEKLKADARKRMDKATQAILGRVVES